MQQLPDDMRFNGRERSGGKRRAFICRLTNGQIAVINEGMSGEDQPAIYPDLSAVKQAFVLLIPEMRIPVYEEYELRAVQRTLATPTAPATK